MINAKQSITITGLGIDSFESCAVAILEIQQMFSGAVPAGAMDKWLPNTEQGCIALEFANRYFSDSDISDADVQLSDDVDPNHILRDNIPSGTRHTTDNEVLYYEKSETDGYAV